MSEDTTTSEQLAEIERQAEPLQVREGRWRTRNGDIRNVTPTPEGDEREERWPWLDAEYGQTWGHDGRYFSGGDSPLDLDTYLGPIEPQPEPQPVQVREGRWRKRSGAEVSVSAMPTDHDHFLAAFPWWDGQESTWTHSGHLLSGGECPADLVEYLGPIEPEDKTQELPDKTQELPDKTQELETKTQELPAEYTPPEGWRVVRFGEQLLPGDMWVHQDGTEQRSAILHWDASAVSGGRCIRRIKPQPEPQPTTDDPSGPGWRDVEPDELLQDGDMLKNNTGLWLRTSVPGRLARQCWGGTYRRRIEAQQADYKTQELPTKTQELETKTQELPEYTPPEGWRVVRFGEQLLPGDVWVNDDGTEERANILLWDAASVSGGRCIRRIVPQPEPESESDAELRIRLLQQANDSQAETIGRLQAAIDERADLDTGDQTRVELQARIRELETIRDTQAATIEELRSEVSYVQRLLGESRQRVTQLEELVGSLRTINDAQEKAFEAAGKENTALRNQLAAVKAELASVAADRQRLQIELDAAQQVPADSPELRQLRADLAEVTRERDQYLDSYQRIFGDLETIRETTKAAAVEAIAEWLEPIRAVDNEHLANETLQHLPQIMRSLVGLDSPEDVE